MELQIGNLRIIKQLSSVSHQDYRLFLNYKLAVTGFVILCENKPTSLFTLVHIDAYYVDILSFELLFGCPNVTM